jgi:hypothetical protein
MAKSGMSCPFAEYLTDQIPISLPVGRQLTCVADYCAS